MEYQEDQTPTQSELAEAQNAIVDDYSTTEIAPYSQAEQPAESYAPAVQEDSPAAYKFWDHNSKSIFNRADPEIRKAWAYTQRRSDARAQKTIDAIKAQYKVFDELSDVLLPYVDEIEATGLTIPEYIKLTIEADKELTASPIDFICKLMDRYDIYNSDVDKHFPTYFEKEKIKEQTRPIRDEVTKLKNDLYVQEEVKEQGKYDNMVQDFFGQVDDHGRLLYPYAQDLKDVMAAIIESTHETDLDKVYRMAYSAAREASATAPVSQEQSFGLSNSDNVPVFAKEPDSKMMGKLAERDYLNRVLSNVASRYGVNVT